MRIIKKFNQYIKENVDLNQDLDPIENIDPTEDNNLNTIENGDDMDDLYSDEEDFELADEDDLEEADFDLIDDIDGDVEGPSYEEDEEGGEVESHQYIGTQMMNDLASMLGVGVVDNEIEYDGKVVNYFSETECFHIDDNKFETVEEAFEYLTSGDSGMEESE